MQCHQGHSSEFRCAECRSAEYHGTHIDWHGLILKVPKKLEEILVVFQNVLAA